MFTALYNYLLYMHRARITSWTTYNLGNRENAISFTSFIIYAMTNNSKVTDMLMLYVAGYMPLDLGTGGER